MPLGLLLLAFAPLMLGSALGAAACLIAGMTLLVVARRPRSGAPPPLAVELVLIVLAGTAVVLVTALLAWLLPG